MQSCDKMLSVPKEFLLLFFIKEKLCVCVCTHTGVPVCRVGGVGVLQFV